MMDKKFLKAYIIKAEALFQICQFEHALLIFHRGQVIDYKYSENNDIFEFYVNSMP